MPNNREEREVSLLMPFRIVSSIKIRGWDPAAPDLARILGQFSMEKKWDFTSKGGIEGGVCWSAKQG